MAKQFRVFLDTDSVKIPLPVGSTPLGRQGLIQINDKKCSRQQVVMQVDEVHNTVTVTRVGVNPSRLIRGDSEILVEKGDPIALENGDLLEVLIGTQPVKIVIEKVEKIINSKTNHPTPKMLYQKLDLEQSDDSDEELKGKWGNTDISEKPKKEVSDSPVVWEWKDGQIWKEFDETTTELIENAYQKGKPTLQLTHGFFQRDTYTIQLAPDEDMKQINNKTKFDRPIQRISKATTKRKREETDTDSLPTKKRFTNEPSSFTGNAFSQLMKAAQSKPDTSSSPKIFKTKGVKADNDDDDDGGKAWSAVLTDYVKNTDKYEKLFYYQDDKVIVIKDKFPKARVHLLVIPKVIILNYSKLDISSLPLLRHMRNVSIEITERMSQEDPSYSFRVGFHAIPSMKQVHMHIISEDFDSPHLKTKKHWNSFTTEYFVSGEDFIKRLEQFGKIEFDKQEYGLMLKKPMRCWKSGKTFDKIPKLKEYLKNK